MIIMPYVSVPKDLTKVKTKIALNLTKRQLICFSIAAAIGVPTYIFSRGTIGNDAAVMLMIGVMLPFFFIAMYEKNGQPAEQVIKNMLRHKLWPAERPYKTENFYKYIDEEAKFTDKKNKATAKTGTKAFGKCSTNPKK